MVQYKTSFAWNDGLVAACAVSNICSARVALIVQPNRCNQADALKSVSCDQHILTSTVNSMKQCREHTVKCTLLPPSSNPFGQSPDSWLTVQRTAKSYCYVTEMCHMLQEAWPRGFWHGIILCCRSAAPSLCMAVSCLPMRITALSASTGNGMLWPAIHFACSAFNTDRKQCLLHTNQLEITLLSS